MRIIWILLLENLIRAISKNVLNMNFTAQEPEHEDEKEATIGPSYHSKKKRRTMML